MFTVEAEFKNKYHIRINKGTPKRITTLTAAVPQKPIYHFLGKSDNLGPEPTDLIVNAISEAEDDPAIYVSHILSLDIDKKTDPGYLGKKLDNEAILIKDYHKRYRQFTRVYDLNRVLDRKHPLIINYQMLDKLYPTRVKRPDTFRWVENLKYDTIWKTASSLNTDRIQFISIHPPRTLQPLSYYRDIIRYARVTDLRKVSTREDLVLLDLFAFYMDPNSDTIIGKYLTEGAAGSKVSRVTPKNITLAIRDDINVFYLPTEKLTEWALEDVADTVKLKWIYELFEFLTSLRPATEDIEEPTYEESIQRLRREVYMEADDTVEEANNIGDYVLSEANELLSSGAISEVEYKANLKLASKYKTLPNPLGGPIDTVVGVLANLPKTTDTPEARIPDMKAVSDKTLLNTKVKAVDEEYVTKMLEPHILRTIMHLQKEGIIITNIRKEEVVDAGNDMNLFTVQTKPVKGSIASFKFEVPKVRADGTMRMGGVNYRMNKQRAEWPILKLNPEEVSLSNAAAKIFVRRGVRKANSYPQWLYANLLNLKSLGFIENVKVGNVFVHDNDLKLPDVYSTLAMRFKTLTVKGMEFNFDYAKRAELTKKNLSDVEVDGILCGKTATDLIFVDEYDNFFTGSGDKLTNLGRFEEILGLDVSKVPVEYAEAKIKGKIVPIGPLVAYWMGMEPFLRHIGCKFEEHEENKRIPGETGIVLRFRDLKVNLLPSTKLQTLLVGGFTYFKDGLREVNFEDMGNRRTMQHMFSTKGIGVGQYTYYRTIERMWVDPITEDLLQEMQEPTDVRDLFIRAAELLTTKQHLSETDGLVKLNKGYNRINDIIYRELMAGISEFNRGSKTAKRTFSINPNAVRMAIAMDSGVSPVAEANPMQVCGEQERITYGGAGGRSNQSLAGRHRKFHKNDMGVISEGFTDNGKAGTILYYTANPNITGMYGQCKPTDNNVPGNLLSASSNVNTFSGKDD